MDNYKIAIIDDNKEKLGLISNDFEFHEPSFDTIELVIDSNKWNKDTIISFLKEQKVDAVIVDYLLKSRNNGVTFNGDKIIHELAIEFRNLPIIMISEVAQEAKKSEINPFLFIEREDFIVNSKSYVNKIYKSITTNRKIIEDSENEIIRLLRKRSLSDEEKIKLVKLDNFLEETSSYESKIPNYFKDNSIMDKLEGGLSTLDHILEKLNNE